MQIVTKRELCGYNSRQNRFEMTKKCKRKAKVWGNRLNSSPSKHEREEENIMRKMISNRY